MPTVSLGWLCFFGRFGRYGVLRAGWSIHCVSRVFITGAVRGAVRSALTTLPRGFIALEDRFVLALLTSRDSLAALRTHTRSIPNQLALSATSAARRFFFSLDENMTNDNHDDPTAELRAARVKSNGVPC
jgi:hypothetical protein